MKNTEKEKKNAEIFNYLKTVYIAKTLEMRYQKKTNQEIIDELNLPSQSNQKQNQLKVSSKKHKKKKVKMDPEVKAALKSFKKETTAAMKQMRKN